LLNQKSTIKILKTKEKYSLGIKSLQIDNIISIDESSFNKEIKENNGYSVIGNTN